MALDVPPDATTHTPLNAVGTKPESVTSVFSGIADPLASPHELPHVNVTMLEPLTTDVLAYDASATTADVGVSEAGVPLAEHVVVRQLTVTVVAVVLYTTQTPLKFVVPVILTMLLGENVPPHEPHVTVK